MPKREDLTGMQFGRLKVVALHDAGHGRRTEWECECVCGKRKIVSGNNLKRGRIKSCGCLHDEIMHNNNSGGGGVKDITGQRFGSLVAVEYKGGGKWLFRCDCGNETVVSGVSVRCGNTKSCGCLHKTHGQSKTRLYATWVGMKGRCNNPLDNAYKHYGGIGIRVCDEWMKFENFYEWAIQNGYREDVSSYEQTIDRIDVDGNYEPDNCRWATMKEQQNNRTNNHMVTIYGETHTLQQWIDLIGADEKKIRWLICKGCDEEKVIMSNAPWWFEKEHFERRTRGVGDDLHV